MQMLNQTFSKLLKGYPMPMPILENITYMRMYPLTIRRNVSSFYRNRWCIQSYQGNLNSYGRSLVRHKGYLLPDGSKMAITRWIRRQPNLNYSCQFVTTASLCSNDSISNASVNDNNNNNNNSNERNPGKVAKRSRIQFDGFEIVYRSPGMSLFRFASRFKLFQVGFILSCTVPSHYWYTHGMISKYVFWTTIGTATSTTLVLFILSYFFRRILGELWISDDGQEILLSTLTFWGNRRNR